MNVEFICTKYNKTKVHIEMSQRGRLKPEDEKRIRENLICLKENIDGSVFIDKFFQEKIITQDERLAIFETSTRLDRADKFINRLLDSGPGKAYEYFVEILREKYTEIAKIIEDTIIASFDSLSYYSWFLNSNNFSDVKKNHLLTSSDAWKLSNCFDDDWPIIFISLNFSSCQIEQEYVRNQQDKRAQIMNLMKSKELKLGKFVDVLKKVEDNKLAIFDWKTLEKFVKELRF